MVNNTVPLLDRPDCQLVVPGLTETGMTDRIFLGNNHVQTVKGQKYDLETKISSIDGNMAAISNYLRLSNVHSAVFANTALRCTWEIALGCN